MAAEISLDVLRSREAMKGKGRTEGPSGVGKRPIASLVFEDRHQAIE